MASTHGSWAFPKLAVPSILFHYLSGAGDVYAWGHGADGQLGSGTTESTNAPQLMEVVEEEVSKVQDA